MTPHPMSQAALEVAQLELLRRDNYAGKTNRGVFCPTYHALLTRLQGAALELSAEAYAQFKAGLSLSCKGGEVGL